jgi:lysozyme
MRRINSKGLNLLKEFEGYSSKPYLDVAGIPTIGHGITFYKLKNYKKVSMEDPSISHKEADLELAAHLSNIESVLEQFATKLKLNLNDNQFSALVCFAYNVGTGAITLPTKSMFTALKENDEFAIRAAFMMYCKATVKGKKVVVAGLLRRRVAEVNLFFS